MNNIIFFVKNNIMNNEEYDKLIKENIKEENIFKNIFIAFISGGLIGTFCEFLTSYIFVNIFKCELNDAYLYTSCFLILIGSILTGLGVFDKVLSICKCGLIVPTTGFANTMTSSAMDTRSEGFVKGIGSSIFKLTGSIILYGVVFGILFGLLKVVIG